MNEVFISFILTVIHAVLGAAAGASGFGFLFNISGAVMAIRHACWRNMTGRLGIAAVCCAAFLGTLLATEYAGYYYGGIRQLPFLSFALAGFVFFSCSGEIRAQFSEKSALPAEESFLSEPNPPPRERIGEETIPD